MRRHGAIARYDEFGGSDTLYFAAQQRPDPGPGEVVVDVVAAGVSHLDAFIRAGRFADDVAVEFPATSGVSFAGIVVAVGAGVSGIRKGAEVVGHDPGHAAHASWVRVPASAVVPKPDRMSWEVAGGLYLPGLTALEIVQSLRLGPGDLVVVSAAAGSVGHLECQLARLAGAEVIGIAGQENHDFLRDIGVEPAAHGDDVARHVRDVGRERTVTAFIDNYGQYDDLARELGVPDARMRTSDDRRAVEVRTYQATGDDAATRTALLDAVELIDSWELRLIVSAFYAAPNLAEASDDLARLHSRGTVVVGMHTAAPAEYYLGETARERREREDPVSTV